MCVHKQWRSAAPLKYTSHKKFSEGKQVYVGMEASKPTKLDGNDTTTLSHHPYMYILCHFATTCTNMLCVFCNAHEAV